MRMPKALAEGQATPAQMAELAKGPLGEKIPQLEPALEGRMEDHHSKVLKLQLRRKRALDQDLAELEADIEEKLNPYRPQPAAPLQKLDALLVSIEQLGPGLSDPSPPRN